MDLNSFISNSDRIPGKLGNWRWPAYLLAVTAVWIAYWSVGPPIADFAAAKYGSKIVSATKHRILDPNLFVVHRLADLAYLVTIVIVAFACIDLAAQVLKRYVSAQWRFLPLAIVVFIILNGACHLSARSALPWLATMLVTPNLRAANSRMSERILWENVSEVPSGVVVGSSQANASLGVSDLNTMLNKKALFADLSYDSGFPATVLMLQSGWKRYPDVTVWYLSVLDFFNHRELGASTQPLMTAQTLRDFEELGGDKVIDPVRMRYAQLGIAMPLFRVRRSAEATFFGEFGTPTVPTFEARNKADSAVQDLHLSSLISLLKTGDDRGEEHYQIAVQFQFDCLRRAVERFERHDAKLVIITGHIHPLVESNLQEQRALLLSTLNGLEAKYENLTVFDDELPQPSAAQYRDLTHLDVKHRAEYSKAVLQVLLEKKLLDIDLDL